MVVHGEPLCRHISATSSSGCTSLSTVRIPEARAKAEALAISLSSCSGNLKSSATDGMICHCMSASVFKINYSENAGENAELSDLLTSDNQKKNS